jgi:crotonobetainyl-CoA:carnitine CoA-transferase CaiB-like acyl-CoA transferase
VQVEHPTFGQHPRLKPYVELSRSQTLAEPGVLAGEHTDKILTELGYDAVAIAGLRERGVVA